MARRFTTPIDLSLLELLRAKIWNNNGTPAGLGGGDAGLIWYDTADNKVKIWNGSAAIDLLARANHTGTQTASTISDLAAVVKAYTLDEFGDAAADLNVGGFKVTNAANGSASGDLVNKGQLDAVAASAASGVSIKEPVRAASTASVTVGSTGNGATMDGVTLATGDRVLLKDQSTPSQNGIYTVGASALTRADDMDATGEVKPGTMVYVTEGTAAGDKQYAVTSNAAITVGTDAMTWGVINSGGTTYTAGDGIDLTGTDFDVVAGTGIVVGTDVAIDTSLVVRKKTGVIPASTSGIFSVSGAVVTINHALSNSAPRLTVRAYTSPVSGYTQGQLVEMEEVASDANNLVVTLPANPASNNWVVTVEG